MDANEYIATAADFLSTRWYNPTPSREWLTHFREHANVARGKSKDSTGVGACLIGDRNEVLLTGFNGPAIGVNETPERRSRENGVKYKFVVHAEENLITFAAKEGISTKGKRIYTSHFPCSNCSNRLVQAGIKEVIVGNGTYVSGTPEELAYSKAILLEGNVTISHDMTSPYEEEAKALSDALLFRQFDEASGLPYATLAKMRIDSLPSVPLEVKIVTQLYDVAILNLITRSRISDRFGPRIAEAIGNIASAQIELERDPLAILSGFTVCKAWRSEVYQQALTQTMGDEAFGYNNMLNDWWELLVKLVAKPPIDEYISKHGISRNDLHRLINE